MFLRMSGVNLVGMERSDSEKRIVVLDEVAQRFELGRTYPEHEVNAVLARIHPDVPALRRYLVDEQFLTREAGVYWRTGGTVDLDQL